MTKKVTKSKVETQVKIVEEESINVFQACNEFKLTGTTRLHVLKKFRGQSYLKSVWENTFKEERVL